MNKKKIGIIGYGKWGKKILPILKEICDIKFLINSKINYKNINHKVDWVFVITNNKSHYEIVKYFLNKKKNVFCEKPLTENYHSTKTLFNLAEKNKVKLYVSDVEYYKKKKIKIKNENNVLRFKRNSLTSGNLLFRLSYHDFYILSDCLKKKNISKFNLILNNNSKLFFSFFIGKKKFNFFYNTRSIINIHKFNQTNFRQFKGNPLKLMFKNIFADKVNYQRNKNYALSASKIIHYLNKKGLR
jgi:hypothetical protein